MPINFFTDTIFRVCRNHLGQQMYCDLLTQILRVMGTHPSSSAPIVRMIIVTRQIPSNFLQLEGADFYLVALR